jgi:cobalamin biosynthesis Mg chelatase CobN
MSDDYSEDFVIEEAEDGGGSSRPFLIAAGALIGVFIILAGCLLSYVLIQRRGDSNAAEVARIESINATTEANNQIVEQTRQAIDEQQALAQEQAQATAEAIATADAVAAAELPATSTPEVQEATAADAQATSEAETAAATAEAATAEAEAAAASADATATAEAMAAAEAAGNSNSDVSGVTGGDTSTALPETGVEVWLIAAAAMGLIALLYIARRLRTIS